MLIVVFFRELIICEFYMNFNSLVNDKMIFSFLSLKAPVARGSTLSRLLFPYDVVPSVIIILNSVQPCMLV